MLSFKSTVVVCAYYIDDSPGVQHNRKAPPYTVYARKEVILAAGAVNTPMVLMLSGIGPASTLSKYGIQVIVDNANVGQNLVVGR